MSAEEQQAFEARVQRHRRELHVHCYRMVASFHDADDLVQETLLRAWRARDTFDPADAETGFRAWLYRIATNACLDFLRSTPRQVSARSFAEVPWLEPYPDRLLDELPAPGTPEGAAVDKETIALGYLALIQALAPRQRAILILRDLLDWSAAETASLLETSVAAANSGLQRARETMQASRATGDAAPAARQPTARERDLLAAFIDAHQRADVAASVALMREDIRVTMPPLPHATKAATRSRRCSARPSAAWASGAWYPRGPTVSRPPSATCAAAAIPCSARSRSTSSASRAT